MQSGLIVGALALGFVIYVTAKGELPNYLTIFGIGANVSSGSAQSSAFSATSSLAQNFGVPSSIANLGTTFLPGLATSGNQDFSGAVVGG